MKKILLLLIYLSFILTFNAFATEPVTDNRGAPSSSQDMPMRERGQGRMGMPPRGENGQFPQPPEGWDGQPSEGFNGQRPQMPQGSNMPFEDMNGQKPLGDTSDSQEASQQQVGGNSEVQQNPFMPAGGMNGQFPGNMQNGQAAEPKSFVETYSTPIISMILLALAYVFVIFYKRKHY